MRSSSRVCYALSLKLTVLLAGCGGERLEIKLSTEDGHFTTAEAENHIGLEARLPARWRSAEVVWMVERGTGDKWTKVTVAPGAETEITVVTAGTARFRGSHPSTAELKQQRLERQRLRYRISAIARANGRELLSDTVEVKQEPVAAIRQEYLDIGLRHGPPPADWFREVKSLPPSTGNGDFDLGVANPEFVERVGRLETIWKQDYKLQWKINSFFRNPAHNRFHIGGGGGSGPVSNSWHQFGCAIDLQTFPVLGRGSSRADTIRARSFWDALAEEALQLDLEVEPRDKNPNRPGASYSGIGHLHLEMDCPP